MALNARLVRGNNNFNESVLDGLLSKTTGRVAILSAKSILSTEIMEILQPLSKTNWSPTNICRNIMDNIQLESFIGVEDSNILECLLYNEFYKVALEISTHTGNVNNSIDLVPKVMDRLRPIINTVMILLSRASN